MLFGTLGASSMLGNILTGEEVMKVGKSVVSART